MTSNVYQIISFHPSRLLYAHTPLERYIRAVAFFLLNPVDHGGLSRIFVVAHGQFQVGLVAVVVENSSSKVEKCRLRKELLQLCYVISTETALLNVALLQNYYSSVLT